MDTMLAGYFDLTHDAGFFDAPFTAGALAVSGSAVSRPEEESYEALFERGLAAVERGELELALGFYDRSLELAEARGNIDQVDRATCNRASLLIALGRGDEIHPYCARSNAQCMPETTFTAAYNLSHAHELRKAFKKALFYAQIARDRALASFQSELIAKAHNQLGNCLLGESYFEEAIEEYQKALGLLKPQMSVTRSAVLLNIGYAKVALGAPHEGFEHFYRCLRWYRRSGKHSYRVWAHIFLCNAHLEVGRLPYARRHGLCALGIGEEAGDQEALKNTLFLLGEVEKADGDFDAAYHYFGRLQRDCYPESTNLPALMLVYDAKQLVNLRG